MKRLVAFITAINILAINVFAYDDMNESTEIGVSVDSSLTLKVENVGGEPEAIFSAWVPSELPIKMDLEGNVVTPSNAQILNGVVDKGIKVTDITANTNEGWNITSYTDNFLDKEVDSKELALQFRGDELQSNGVFSLSDGNWNIPKDSYIDLGMQAKVPKQTEEGSKGNIASAEFTLDWSGDDVSTEPLDTPTVYTIYLEDGEHGSISDKTTLKTNSYSIVPELPSTTPDEQYRFVNWVNVETEEVVKAGHKITSDITIRPLFEYMETVVLTFVADEGGEILGDSVIEVPYGTKYGNVQEPLVVDSEGFAFDAYYRENDVPAVAEYVLTEDQTFKAEFFDLRVPDGAVGFNGKTPANYFSYDLLTLDELLALDLCTDGVVLEEDYPTDEYGNWVAAVVVGMSSEYSSLANKPTAVTIPSKISNIKSSRDDNTVNIGNYTYVPYGEYPVVAVNYLSYGNTVSNDNAIRSCYIPDSVRFTGENAFSVLNNLEYVRLSEFTDKIRNPGFCGTKINNLKIPDRVTDIENATFANLTTLTNLELGSGLRSVQEFAAPGAGMSSLYFYDNLTFIGDSAFINTAASKIRLSNKLSNVGDSVFAHARNLRSITIPGSLKTVGSSMFQNNTSLESLIVRDGVEAINDTAFVACSKLKYVALPNTLKRMGNTVFAGNASLEQFIMPDSVTSVGQCLFGSCSSLKGIKLSENLETITTQMFASCSALESITIPNSVTEIGQGAFDGCTSLKEVIIGDGVETIKAGAFNGCTSLETLEIPNSVTTIEAGAFTDCTALKNITISGRIHTLSDGVLDNSLTSLESVTIRYGLETIGANAFDGLTSINNITLPSSLKTIESQAFANCDRLTELTIPKSVETIASDAFSSNCHIYYNGPAEGRPWGAGAVN